MGHTNPKVVDEQADLEHGEISRYHVELADAGGLRSYRIEVTAARVDNEEESYWNVVKIEPIGRDHLGVAEIELLDHALDVIVENMDIDRDDLYFTS